jgi:hypothetical protein
MMTDTTRESDEALIERIEGMLHLNEAIGIPAGEGSTIGLGRDTLARLLELAKRGLPSEATGEEAARAAGRLLSDVDNFAREAELIYKVLQKAMTRLATLGVALQQAAPDIKTVAGSALTQRERGQ